MMKPLVVATVIACWCSRHVTSMVLPPEFIPDGFEDVEMFNIPDLSTDLVWTPSGELLTCRRNGQVRFYPNWQEYTSPQHPSQLVLDLGPVSCGQLGDRGLMSITLHPDFETNRWIYLYYTFKKTQDCDGGRENGPVNRVSRFVLPDNMVIDPSTEVVLLETSSVATRIHMGGDTAFGKDGYLYITTGEGGYSPYAQSLANIQGKILRITDTGEIPPDNPLTPGGGFTSQPSARCNVTGVPPAGTPEDTVCQEIYAIGLRNPFNFAMDPNSDRTKYYINDVGTNVWEKVFVGGDDHVLANYGWDLREGPCEPYTDEPGRCRAPDPALGLTEPIHWYNHEHLQAAITGGTFVPNGLWPQEYDGAYLFSDFMFGDIYFLNYTGNGCRNCDVPTSDYESSMFVKNVGVSPLRMKFGPWEDSQALYYTAQTDSGAKLHRVSFVGNDTSPTAVINTLLTPNGNSLTVEFDGTGSSDPNNDTLSFLWDFGVAGSTPSTNSVATYQYSSPGPFTATLTVTNSQGRRSIEDVVIRVDNQPKSLASFRWSEGGTMTCPGEYDYCGMLEFCKANGRNGYRVPCAGSCPCNSGPGPVIRLKAGNKYKLTLMNSATDSTPTNLHTHGLHIVGAGDSDDVTRVVPGGHCLDYTWDIREDHPGGTHWYHAHHHRLTTQQVRNGAFGMLIVEDNNSTNNDIPDWASNDLLLQISTFWGDDFGNGNHYDIFDIDADQWYRLRVSISDVAGIPDILSFAGGCEVHKVASDGIWHSTVPGPQETTFELTGASRGDFALRCASNIPVANVRFGKNVVAIIKVGSAAQNPFVMSPWTPARPPSLQNIAAVSVPSENMLDITIQPFAINEITWDPNTPLATIAYDAVHEWTIYHTEVHPFHLHLYHMLIVTPGGCGAHKEGEFYDTIASPVPCTVRFKTADFGERCVFHCHVLPHEDNGAMAWVNVQGPNMPVTRAATPSRSCSAGSRNIGSRYLRLPQDEEPESSNRF